MVASPLETSQKQKITTDFFIQDRHHFMRTGKELILATKPFCKEDRARSWRETLTTLFLTLVVLGLTFAPFPIAIRLALSVLCGLFYVRMFVIYHDYQHHAILQESTAAQRLMTLFGIYILAPQTIWKRTHDYHHFHNSKLTISGIGSYPTISKEQYLALDKKDQTLYLVNRHPLTIIFGYFTLFIFWLNIKSYIESPKKHLDSLISILVHFTFATLIIVFLGWTTFFVAWFIPFFIAFALGSYLFYCQHNFPGAKFRENHDWTYDNAAIASTSFMVMPGFMHWFTGMIGYHHVHHLNAKIPFYRLKEAKASLPELDHVATTSWNPIEVYKCFMLKFWDPEKDRMITLRELKKG